MTKTRIAGRRSRDLTTRLSRWQDPALSVAAAILGLAVPLLPLARRRAWWLAGIAALIWLAALYVFFAHFAGPGFLAHMALWFAAVLGMAQPLRLEKLDQGLGAAFRSLS